MKIQLLEDYTIRCTRSLPISNLKRLASVFKILSNDAELPQCKFSKNRFATVLTGIGGGQLFGLKTMSPVDSAKQLWVDYLRSNALGLYRNEGTDGHELNIKMRQDGVYKDLENEPYRCMALNLVSLMQGVVSTAG